MLKNEAGDHSTSESTVLNNWKFEKLAKLAWNALKRERRVIYTVR